MVLLHLFGISYDRMHFNIEHIAVIKVTIDKHNATLLILYNVLLDDSL